MPGSSAQDEGWWTWKENKKMADVAMTNLRVLMQVMQGAAWEDNNSGALRARVQLQGGQRRIL